MGKGKGKKADHIPNKSLYSRISFLQQAAALLSAPPEQSTESQNGAKQDSVGMARRLATDMRAISLKARIRLSPAIKNSICKFCDSTLMPGQTCTSTIENKSRDGQKPWADMLVTKCHTCGKEKRFPVAARRPPRKTDREKKRPGVELKTESGGSEEAKVDATS